GQAVAAAPDPLPGRIAVCDLFGHQLLLLLFRFAVDDGQHFVFPHDEVLLAIELDLLTRVLAEEDHVARLDVERDALAVLLDLSAAGGDHLAALRLFLRAVRDDDASAFLLALREAANDD